MRILVTGGAGYVGSQVVDRLTLDGHDVVVLDRRVPAVVNPAVDHRGADVRDPEAWLACLREVEAVCHLAAATRPADVRDLVGHNDGGTAAGLWALERIRFTGRLVLVSTTAVEVEPLSLYAATKLHQEHLCLAFGRERGVAVTVLRYPALVGAGMALDSPDLAAPGEPMAVEEAAAGIAAAVVAPVAAYA